MSFRDSLVTQYADFNRGLSEGEVRFLARHIIWRIRYSAALKIGGPLFRRGLFDLTPDQQALMYWSNFYQSIYDMMPDEKPHEDIIENDEDLDAFMSEYFKRREAEQNDGTLKRKSGGKGNLSTRESGEVIVTTNHPDYLSTVYSEERVKAGESSNEVEVISPNSRRARNRRGQG